MPRLSQFQIEILMAATRRPDGLAPFPRNPTLRQIKLITELVFTGLLEEKPTSPNMPCWRRDTLGRPLCLKISKQGFRLIAGTSAPVRPRAHSALENKGPARHKDKHDSTSNDLRPPTQSQRGSNANAIYPETKGVLSRQPALSANKHRKCEGKQIKDNAGAIATNLTHRTKAEIILLALKHPNGVTVSELCQELDWQRHSVRAAISRQIRGNPRLAITAEAMGGRGRVLRIEDKSSEEFLRLIDQEPAPLAAIQT